MGRSRPGCAVRDNVQLESIFELVERILNFKIDQKHPGEKIQVSKRSSLPNEDEQLEPVVLRIRRRLFKLKQINAGHDNP